MKAALQNYQARMRRVLDYIDRHLDRDLDLDTVSGVAAFSRLASGRGEEARDFPIHCQRLSFFPEVPEHEAVADLFLPLK